MIKKEKKKKTIILLNDEFFNGILKIVKNNEYSVYQKIFFSLLYFLFLLYINRSIGDKYYALIMLIIMIQSFFYTLYSLNNTKLNVKNKIKHCYSVIISNFLL